MNRVLPPERKQDTNLNQVYNIPVKNIAGINCVPYFFCVRFIAYNIKEKGIFRNEKASDYRD